MLALALRRGNPRQRVGDTRIAARARAILGAVFLTYVMRQEKGGLPYARVTAISGKPSQRDLGPLLDLGDFRQGSVTTTQGRSGKPRCRCRQSGDPGHGAPAPARPSSAVCSRNRGSPTRAARCTTEETSRDPYASRASWAQAAAGGHTLETAIAKMTTKKLRNLISFALPTADQRRRGSPKKTGQPGLSEIIDSDPDPRSRQSACCSSSSA